MTETLTLPENRKPKTITNDWFHQSIDPVRRDTNQHKSNTSVCSPLKSSAEYLVVGQHRVDCVYSSNSGL